MSTYIQTQDLIPGTTYVCDLYDLTDQITQSIPLVLLGNDDLGDSRWKDAHGREVTGWYSDISPQPVSVADKQIVSREAYIARCRAEETEARNATKLWVQTVRTPSVAVSATETHRAYMGRGKPIGKVVLRKYATGVITIGASACHHKDTYNKHIAASKALDNARLCTPYLAEMFLLNAPACLAHLPKMPMSSQVDAYSMMLATLEDKPPTVFPAGTPAESLYDSAMFDAMPSMTVKEDYGILGAGGQAEGIYGAYQDAIRQGLSWQALYVAVKQTLTAPGTMLTWLLAAYDVKLIDTGVRPIRPHGNAELPSQVYDIKEWAERLKPAAEVSA
jgi:hypothetical protein